MENDNGSSKGGAGPSQPADSSSAQTGIFVRSGDQWTIAYGGTTFSLRDMKGLAYVQRLLQHPYEKFHALDLVGWNTAGVGSGISGAEHRLPTGVSVRGLGDAGVMLDTQAKQEYRARLRDLRQELEELRKGADHERGEKVEAEIDFIEREIIRAVGLGGRDRHAGSAAERARLNVTRTIKIALQRIADQHAALGELLETSIRTGLFSAYIPTSADGVSWHCSSQSTEPQVHREVSTPVTLRFANTPFEVVGAQSVFVGREAEKVLLRRHLNLVRDGRGSVVLFGGTAGVGKTRIAIELAVEAAGVGPTTLVGHCYDREDPVPFAPFVEILEAAMEQASSRAGFRELLSADAAEISRLMPQLSRLFSDIPAAMELAPAQSQWILFKAVADLLGRMASGNPLLLLLEDLHWADQGTLALLEHLARNVYKIHALIVANYRDDELDSKGPVAQTLGELTRLRLAEQVNLRGLPEDAVAEMIQSLSGSEPSAALVRLLHKTTDGNPFFVGELIRHLAERGELGEFNGKTFPELTPDQLDLPDSLRLVIGRRVNRIGDETRRVLAAAAVIGRSFPFALLEAVTRADPDLLLDHVEEAERAGLISSEVVQQDAQFKFAHELIRRAVLDELSAVRRQRLHQSVAEAIEAIHPDTADDHARDLAHHLWNAGAAADTAKTIHYSRLAGDQAAQSYSNVEAEQHYAHALAAASKLPPLEPGALIDLYSKRGAVLNILGRHDDAIADYQRAREIARSTRDRQREVLILFRLSGVYWDTHQKDPTLEYSQQALTLARETGDKFLETLCVIWTLSAGNMFGPNSLAREEAEKALNSAETTGSPLLRGFAHQTLGCVLQWQANFDRSIPHLNQAIEFAGQIHEGRLYGPSLLHLGSAYLSKGEYEEALRYYGRFAEFADRAGDKFLMAVVANLPGGVRLELYDFGEALKNSLESYETACRLSPWTEPRGHTLTKAGLAYFELGDFALADKFFLRAWGLLEDEDELARWRWLMVLLRGRGELALARGQRDEAWKFATESFDLASKTVSRKHIARAQWLQGEILAANGCLDEAAKTLDASAMLAEQIGTPREIWIARSALGRVLGKLGRDNEVEAQFVKAADAIEAVSSKLKTRALSSSLLSAETVRAVYKALGRQPPLPIA